MHRHIFHILLKPFLVSYYKFTEIQSNRHSRVLSIRAGEIFLCLISINSPTGFARRGIIHNNNFKGFPIQFQLDNWKLWFVEDKLKYKAESCSREVEQFTRDGEILGSNPNPASFFLFFFLLSFVFIFINLFKKEI